MPDETRANPGKKSDDAWKESVEREKRDAAPEGRGEEAPTDAPPPVDFSLFVSTLGLQAYVALGEVADPATRQRKVNLDQAKYMIDMIAVIEEKTTGNLAPEESEMISRLLYDLRLKFIEKNRGN